MADTIIKREHVLCECCMEEHEVLTVETLEKNIFKSVVSAEEVRKMATAIIIILLIAVCVTAVKSYMKKLAHGCCGAGGGDEKSEAHKTDLSEYKYKYTVSIGGMTCKNCAARIENAFNRQDIYAQADFKKGAAEIYSRTPVAEFAIRQIIVGLGYSVERTEEKEL